MSARNRELLGLVPASLLLTAGFAAAISARPACSRPVDSRRISATRGSGTIEVSPSLQSR